MEKAAFQEVVKELWDTHVRAELIYYKKLRFCKTCFAFYYQTDPESDHPMEDTESVQKFFGDAGITSLSRLINFLWNAFSRMKGFQPVLSNIMTGKHKPVSLADQQMISLQEYKALHAKITQQQNQLMELTKKAENLETEKDILLKENEELMEEFLKAKSHMAHDMAKVHRLCSQIGTLCHPRGCCESLG